MKRWRTVFAGGCPVTVGDHCPHAPSRPRRFVVEINKTQAVQSPDQYLDWTALEGRLEAIEE